MAEKINFRSLKIGPGAPGNPRDRFKIEFKKFNFSKNILGKFDFLMIWHRFGYFLCKNSNSAPKIIQKCKFRSKFRNFQ